MNNTVESCVTLVLCLCTGALACLMLAASYWLYTNAQPAPKPECPAATYHFPLT